MKDVVLAMRNVLERYAKKYEFDICKKREEKFLQNRILGYVDIENIIFTSKLKEGSVDMDNFWGKPRICLRSYEEKKFENKETLVSISFDRESGKIHNINAYNERGIELALNLKKEIELEIWK